MKAIAALIVVFMSLCGLHSAPAAAQASEQVMLLRGLQLILWDLTTLQETLYLDLSTTPLPPGVDPENRLSIMGIEVDSVSQSLYLLEGFGQQGVRPPQATRIVKIDWLTRQQTVIFEAANLFAFDLSPDGQHSIVAYYEGEYGQSRRYSCVLDMVSGVCSFIDLVVGNFGWSWIDNDTYVALSYDDGNLYRVNIETLATQFLDVGENWYLDSAIPVPATHILLISATLRTNTAHNAAQFLTFDMDTLTTSDFLYDAASDDYVAVNEWKFSPDGAYLLYGRYQRALVDFQTGSVIAEFDTASQAEWLPDSSGLLIHRLQPDKNEPQVIHFNLATGQTTVLAEGWSFGYMVVLPATFVPLPIAPNTPTDMQ